MNSRSIALSAWISLALAVLAWAGLGFFAWTIQQDQESRAGALSFVQASASKQAGAIRDHALISDTVQERQRLAQLGRPDVLSVADLIDTAGKAAGVDIHLGGASPKGTSAIAFTLDADAKFPNLMRAISLLGTLPVSSSITRLDIERVPTLEGQTSGLWHMSAEISVAASYDPSQ